MSHHNYLLHLKLLGFLRQVLCLKLKILVFLKLYNVLLAGKILFFLKFIHGFKCEFKVAVVNKKVLFINCLYQPSVGCF